MRENTNNTTPEAQSIQLELVRNMPAEERVARAIRLTSEMIRCSKAAIRRHHPEMNEAELSLKFIELHYGAALAEEVRLKKGGVNR